MDNRYVIEEKMLLKLITAYFKLNALKAGGVDNWSWYGDSLNDYLRKCMPKDLDEDEYWDYGFEGLAEDLLQTFVVDRFEK